MSYLVGLTGGIGSGKSTVAELLSALGARVIDTDAISHQLTKADGAAIPLIRKAFGDDYIDARGAMDRSRMRTLVFSDLAAKQRLEAILHPLILDQSKRQADSPTAAPYTLIVVPLLFESGNYIGWLDRTVAVDCPEEMQITRTMQRSQLGESDIRAIMSRQIGRAERQKLADEIILNQGSLEDLKTQVVGLHRRLSALAAESD